MGKIAEKMKLCGYSVRSEILDRKMRNIKDTYRKIIDNKKKTGRGPMKWEYFKVFDDIFQTYKTINISETLSSSALISDNEISIMNEANFSSIEKCAAQVHTFVEEVINTSNSTNNNLIAPKNFKAKKAKKNA